MGYRVERSLKERLHTLFRQQKPKDQKGQSLKIPHSTVPFYQFDKLRLDHNQQLHCWCWKPQTIRNLQRPSCELGCRQYKY